MTIHSFPKGLLAEVLHFIADNIPSTKLEGILGSYSPDDLRAAIRELAVQTGPKGGQEGGEEGLDLKSEELTPATRNLLTLLSPKDEKKLLRGFGFS